MLEALKEGATETWSKRDAQWQPETIFQFVLLSSS